MSPAIFISILLIFESLTFTGTQLLGYHGIFSSLLINLDVKITVNTLPDGGYNVTVEENGMSYNNTLNLHTIYKGKYYYIINLNRVNNTLLITYYVNNVSSIGLLSPFYMPYSINGTVVLNEKIINYTSGKIQSQLITNASIENINGNVIMNFSSLNLTVVPVYFVSQRITYNNYLMIQLQSNYTNSNQIYLYTNIVLAKNTINSSLLGSGTLMIIIIVTIIVIVGLVSIYKLRK